MLIRNHLNFRIAESKRIEKLRGLQAFALNEVQNNPVYTFDESSKAALVLQYEIWNEWVGGLGKVLLNVSTGNVVTVEMKNFFVNSAKESLQSYLDSMGNNSDHFPKEFVEVHRKTYTIMADRFIDNLYYTSNMTAIEAIIYLTRSLESFLQSALFELQEVDYLIFHDDMQHPFISIDQQDLNDANNSKSSSTVQRVKVYKKFFDMKNIVVKSYIEGPCNLSSVLEPIKALGIHIDRVKF